MRSPNYFSRSHAFGTFVTREILFSLDSTKAHVYSINVLRTTGDVLGLIMYYYQCGGETLLIDP